MDWLVDILNVWLVDILNVKIINNTIWQYLLSVLLFFIIKFSLYGFQNFFIKRIKKNKLFKGKNIGKVIIDYLDSLPNFFYISISVIIPLLVLDLPSKVDFYLHRFLLVILSFYIIKFIYKILYHYLIDVYLPSEDWDPQTIDKNKKNMLELVLQIFVWATWWLFILNNAWVSITPLIASLWIWGIAVWFALQNILSDIFASFSIFFDKPFKIWDYIVVWEDKWTVVDITFKSTRIQTLEWQMLTIPNKDITNARINNYSQIAKRRTKLLIWVVYETNLEKLKKIPDLIKQAIESEDRIEIMWVVFKSYWDFSLNFEAVYYVHTSDYMEYLQINNNINYKLFEIFEQNWIEFAYPTQVIKLSNDR